MSNTTNTANKPTFTEPNERCTLVRAHFGWLAGGEWHTTEEIAAAGHFVGKKFRNLVVIRDRRTGKESETGATIRLHKSGAIAEIRLSGWDPTAEPLAVFADVGPASREQIKAGLEAQAAKHAALHAARDE